MSEHPLECAWDLYAHPIADSTTYRTAYVHLGRASTCEEWGALWAHAPGGDALVGKYIRRKSDGLRLVALSFFRQGAKPEWEDAANHGGTTLSCRVTLPPERAKTVWTVLCADCARGAADDVVGVQMTQKWGNTLKVDVWLKAGADVPRAIATVHETTQLTVGVAPREAAPPRPPRLARRC